MRRLRQCEAAGRPRHCAEPRLVCAGGAHRSYREISKHRRERRLVDGRAVPTGPRAGRRAGWSVHLPSSTLAESNRDQRCSLAWLVRHSVGSSLRLLVVAFARRCVSVSARSTTVIDSWSPVAGRCLGRVGEGREGRTGGGGYIWRAGGGGPAEMNDCLCAVVQFV